MQKLKKYLALLLALVLCLSLLSVGVFADEDETAVDGDVTEETEVTDTEESGAADVAAEDQEPDIAESETADDADETTEEAEAEAPADTTAVDVELEEAVNSGETEEAAEIDESEKAPAEGDEAFAEKPAEEVVVAWEAVKAEVTVIEVQPQRWPQDADLTISRDAGDYNVTVDVPEGAFAEDVEFRVVALSWAELDADTYAQLIDAGMTEDDALLDIGFYSVETGEEVEPELAISVSIQTKAVEIAEVYHVEDKETITLVAEEVAEFTVESFSLYIVKSNNTVVSIDVTGSMTDEQYSAAQEFTVSSAQGLAKLAEYVNSDRGFDFSNKLVTLTSDITLSDNWTPIGNGARKGTGNAFKGTFDGGSHTISGLCISSSSGDENAIGLFGLLDGGTVKNLTLENVSVVIDSNSQYAVGGAVGAVVNGGTVENIIVSGTVTGGKGVGGVVGMMVMSGTITNCKNSATITAKAYNAGGIVGTSYCTAEDKALTISDCENSGSISTKTGAGGIVGLSSSNVTNCKNTGAVTGSGTSVGGIVGEQKAYGTINGCENTATITNSFPGYGTGGIVGWVRYPGSTELNSYVVRTQIKVTGNKNSGNIAGGNDGGGIVGSLYMSGVVSGNENTASSITGVTFAGGIVGSFQFTELGNVPTDTTEVAVFGNTSSTTLDSMTATCKALIVYDNEVNGSHPAIIYNNRPSDDDNAVAKIGEKPYKTLAGAIAAVTDSQKTTITMVADETLSAGLVIATDKEIVLDLNGHELTGILGGTGTTALIKNLGNLTIKDSTDTAANGTGSGKISSYAISPDTGDVPGYASNLITNHGTLTIESGYLESSTNGWAAYVVDNLNNSGLYNPVLNVAGGHLHGKYTDVIRIGVNTRSASETNTVTISGGVIDHETSGRRVIWVQYFAANNGTVYLNISAGKVDGIIATYRFANSGANSGYMTDGQAKNFHFALSNTACVTGAVRIFGYRGEDATDWSSNISISGGVYSGIYVAGKASKFITGGTFSSDPTAYVADDAVALFDGESTYTVVSKPELHAAMDADCENAGTIAHYQLDGVYYVADADNMKLLTKADSITDSDKPALGHDYTDVTPTWSWVDYTAATASFACTREGCGHVENVTAEITSARTAPTYTAEGSIVYTATATLNGTPYTDTRTVVLAMLVDDTDYDDDYDDTPAAPVTPVKTVEIKDEATPLSALPEDYDEVTVTIGDEEVPLAEVPLVYSDVAVESWSRDAIAFVTATGIMNGTGEEEFAPIATSTGDMVATMVYRFATGDVTTGANWAEAGLAWASENALTEGIGFDANQATTREQLVTILYRMAAMEGYDVSASADLSNFADADKLSGFAAEAMSWAVSVGLIKGTSDTTLSSEDSVTREQIATIFMRYALLLGK